MRTLFAALLTLFVSACMGSGPSGDPRDPLAGSGGAYVLTPAPGWSVTQRGEGGVAAVLAHEDGVKTAKGYPTLVVKAVRTPTPQGVLEVMARDRNLEFTALWHVSPERYALRHLQQDDTARTLVAWLVPKDGTGLEYYLCVRLTGFGRLELTGVGPAGSLQKYIKDFNTMFAGLEFAPQARFSAASAGDVGASLRGTYAQAVGAEDEALGRLMAEAAQRAAAGDGLSAQERTFLRETYARASAKAREAARELEGLLARPLGEEGLRGLPLLADRLDESATALETVALNIRDPQARSAVEKSGARARRLAALAREASRLPL
ncbi:hypothetical protein NNJEOMEG_02331 [Fundidesulfovibrio magnetotacticus]|uniref:Lipoprotein n=1 Tax=Fundidesulfovibrio magnetotacticus TaxID=2730080 RepID=A0A6V8M201_9BACT|nr:hypothetical protein [Fundidesulfovibrio magnetotacticus]GFK94485.1 hypothetical protein NNJEOMEG_02331 [Fundidesulfovibrio magnetotacticus]